MTKDYETYFDKAGITSEVERQAVLGYVEELFAIAIECVVKDKEEN